MLSNHNRIKLEISNKRYLESPKYLETDQELKGKSQAEFLKVDLNENESTIYQNVWDTAFHIYSTKYIY